MSDLTQLFNFNGGFSLPWLIHLYGSNSSGDVTYDMRFVNDNADCEYEGETYTAESFAYTPSFTEYGMNGAGTLEISAAGNQVSNLVQLCTSINLEVVAIILENGNVTPIQVIKHKNGHIKGNRQQVTFDFDRDERLDMSFPALIWNSQNNRGNA